MVEKNSNLIYDDLDKHITREQLNSAYGNVGMEYENSNFGRKAARKHAEDDGKRVTKIFDYYPKDIIRVEDEDGKYIGMKIRDGARPFIKGYLVN